MEDGSGWFRQADTKHEPRALVVAEIGVNHDGNAGLARQLIVAAADAGADAVKFQLFHPDRLLSNDAALAQYQQGQANDPRELLAKLTLSLTVLAELRDAARQRGLRFIVTPFSEADVADLADLDVDAVKIASPDAVNAPMLRAAAALGRPMLISTGTCDLDELGPAVDVIAEKKASGDPTFRESGNRHGRELPGALLHCVSSYPTPRLATALGGIVAMRQAFDVPVGYSDHTPSLDTGALAVMAGAVVLEKHLTHDRAALGPDHAASLTPEDFDQYVKRAREAQTMHGATAKQALDLERDVRRVSRQSVCVVRDLPAGHRLMREDVTWKRPGTGIPAAELDAVIGRTLSRTMAENHLLDWEDLAKD